MMNDKLPEGWMDWNELTLDQMAEYLDKMYHFQSSGDAKCILTMVDFYNEHKENYPPPTASYNPENPQFIRNQQGELIINPNHSDGVEKEKVSPTEKEELNIYRDLLISLHTCRWTGNNTKVLKIMDAIAAYSYARTNSNGDPEDEERNQRQTLLNLKNV